MFSTAYSGFIVDFSEDSDGRTREREVLLYFRRQKESVGPACHPVRLFSFTIAFACLLFFFSAPSGAADQRISNGQSVFPRLFLMNPQASARPLPKVECRQQQSATHHALCLGAQAEFLPPQVIVLPAPLAYRGAPQPIESSASLPPKVEKLDARGPPA